MKAEQVRESLKKYRLPLLAALAGVVILLLPTGGDAPAEEPAAEGETYSLTETETRMEQLIGSMDGVGKVRVMLTLRSGETLSLAQDSSTSRGTGGDTRQERQILTVNRGSGQQEVVVTERRCPVYQGAVVVCQGAGDSRVRLAVIETVSVLTGLSSDKISVVKWKN